MADLSNGSGVYQTYDNSGSGVAELGDNKAAKSGQGIAGRTRVLNLAKSNMTTVELEAAIKYLTAGDVSGTNDAHTVVAVQPLTESGVFTSGTTDAVQVVIQGTGAATMASNFGTGSTGITATLIAEFSGLQA
jgi:hypothetical protein|tara:strand:+ start:171 stop:569 length:399 start_codon:yes stop_codon:yes gene_type:complete